MQSQLITAGCSYTQYCWPTWANYLATAFSNHVQLGMSGMDCARTARNILDHDISPKDTVVICWTGFDRFNFYSNNEWKGLGSIFSNKVLLTDFYHPIERFAAMYDAMTLVDLDSRQRGYQAWHFSAFPWLLGEIEKHINPTNQQRSKSRNLRNLFMEKDLESFKISMGDPKISHKYNSMDDHPTPDCHYNWLKKVVLPVLGIDISIDDRVKLDQERVLKGDID